MSWVRVANGILDSILRQFAPLFGQEMCGACVRMCPNSRTVYLELTESSQCVMIWQLAVIWSSAFSVSNQIVYLIRLLLVVWKQWVVCFCLFTCASDTTVASPQWRQPLFGTLFHFWYTQWNFYNLCFWNNWRIDLFRATPRWDRATSICVVLSGHCYDFYSILTKVL